MQHKKDALKQMLLDDMHLCGDDTVKNRESKQLLSGCSKYHYKQGLLRVFKFIAKCVPLLP